MSVWMGLDFDGQESIRTGPGYGNADDFDIERGWSRALVGVMDQEWHSGRPGGHCIVVILSFCETKPVQRCMIDDGQDTPISKFVILGIVSQCLPFTETSSRDLARSDSDMELDARQPFNTEHTQDHACTQNMSKMLRNTLCTRIYIAHV
jgi:hypothetical protein